MDTVIAGRPAIELVKLCYAANRPLLLCGPHGIGKSELLKQAAAELNIGYICRDLSLMEPPDLIGLPKANGEVTVYLPPASLPKEGRGFLAFEELNRAEKYMRAPCLQLLTERILNDYCLPAGWLPVASINPSDADYEVSDLDVALLSRFVQVRVVANCGEWLEWARQSGVHHSVIRYVESDTTAFDSAESSPRSWKYVSELVAAADKVPVSEATLRTAVLGTVGSKRGTAFLKLLTGADRPLTAREILSSYNKHQAMIQQWISTGRIDIVEMTLRHVLVAMQPVAEYKVARAKASTWKKLGLFLGDLPGDLREQAREFFSKRKYEFPDGKPTRISKRRKK